MDSTENTTKIPKVVLDLGKKSKKKIKRLSKGKGSLAKKLDDKIAELQQAGTITPATQVIVIVKESRKSKGLFNLLK